MSEARPLAAPPKRRPGGAAAVDDHAFYPIHEEDNVPENPLHERLARYLKDALDAFLPEKWVTGDVCMYWEPGNRRDYAAPDVLVTEGPAPDPVPPVYLRWKDAAPLLVIEVGSRSTFVRDTGPRLAVYAWYLAVPEYLYYHPERREIHLYRLEEGGYREVLPDAAGRVCSERLGVCFGADEKGLLWAYTPAGERLLSHDESEQARRAAEQAHREAEARARREAEARAAAERRVAELEEKLRRLGEAPG